VTTPTDEQLLAEHVAGNPGRFEELVRRHSDELFRFLARFTGNAAAGEDLVQEVFLQVYLSAESFDLSRRLKPWLFTIAANKARDMLRSRRRRPEVPLDAQVAASEIEGQTFRELLEDISESPLEELEQEEEKQFVRKIVEDMPVRLREVLILCYYHRFPYKEIADILDVPLGTVKSRLHSAVEEFGKAYRAALKERALCDD